MGNSQGMPLYFEASRYLIGEMTKAAEATNHNVKNGLIVKRTALSMTDVKYQEILRHFPDALALRDGRCCDRPNSEAIQYSFLVVRAISDTADHAATVSFDEFIFGSRQALCRNGARLC